MTSIQTSFNPSVIEGNTTTFTKADVTATGQGGAWTTANSGLTLFTVTGVVEARVFGVVTTQLTSTANTGTLAVGVTGNTGLFLAATTADNATKLLLNKPWVDSSALAVLAVAFPTLDVASYLLNGSNIILTIATNNMTAGGVTLYCQWNPISAGATVV